LSVWAPQQAACARQRASRASNRRQGHQIRSERLRTHYRVNGRGSSRAGAGSRGRLTINGRPTRAKNRRKMMEVQHFAGSEDIYRVRRNPALARAIWNRVSRGIESARQCHRINFTRFRRSAGQPRGENSQSGPGLASRTPCRLLSRLRVIETAEPGKHAPKRVIPDTSRS
jgi:hypothetical protein